jgi:hypothetical protein
VGRKVQILLASLLSAPAVFAINTGVPRINDTINRVFDIFGAFFNFNLNSTYYDGVIKGLFFLAFFALFNWSARKLFNDTGPAAALNKKTANIISFALALIATFLTPNGILMDLGAIWSVILVLLFALLPPAIALMIAYKPRGEGENRKAPPNILGAALILLSWLYVEFLYQYLQNRGAFATGTWGGIAEVILSWALLIIPIAFIIKLIQSIFSIGGGGGSLVDTLNSAKNTVEAGRDLLNTLRKKHPGIVSDVRFSAAPGNGVTLQWAANPDVDNVDRYQIQRTRDGIDNVWYPVDETVPTRATSIVVRDVPPNVKVRFRVRAVNKDNNIGAFGKSDFVEPNAAPAPRSTPNFTTRLNDLETKITAARTALDSAAGVLSKYGVYDEASRRVTGILRAPPSHPAHYEAVQIEMEIDNALTVIAAAQVDANAMIASPDLASMTSADYTRLVHLVSDLQQQLVRAVPLQTVDTYAVFTT